MMRRALVLGLLGGMVALAATRIRDTVYYAANGQRAAGQVTITWPSFTVGGKAVVAGRRVIQLTGGVLSVDLEPNDAAAPAGTQYAVQYRLSNGTVAREFWVVPTSAGVKTIPDVRVVMPAVGDCQQWTGMAWTPAKCSPEMKGVD